MSNVLCTICARGGSKGVKNKNIKLLNGMPLIAHTILAAKQANIFDHIVISTDSDDIANIAIRYGAEVFFKREAKLADDKAGKLDVIKDAFMKSEHHYDKQYDYLIDLDATSPLRAVKDIKNSFSQFLEKGGCGNLFSVSPSHKNPYFNMVELDDKGFAKISKPLSEHGMVLSRQAAPQTFDINGAIYIWDRETLLNNNTIFLDRTLTYLMPVERSIDIDTELDFKFVEFLISNK